MTDHATLEVDGGVLTRFLRLATLARRGDYQYAYLNVEDGELRVVASTSNSVNSYSTLTDDAIEVLDDADYHEALLDLETFWTFYGFLDDAATITLTFRGDDDAPGSTSVLMEGSLQSNLYLPAATAIRDQMPLWLPGYFEDDDSYLDQGETPLTTTLTGSAEAFQKISTVVGSDEIDVSDRYPVVVEDGELRLEVADDMSRSSVAGTLDVTVDGPDVSNLYGVGFVPVFDALDGDVTVTTSPGGGPLCVLKDDGDAVYRHVITSTGSV